MSWGKSTTPTPEPTPANVESTDLASNERSVPVPWWIGPRWCPLTWIVPEVYNVKTVEIRQRVGKSRQTTGYDYFGDVAGIAGLGLISRILAIESDGTLVWQGSKARPDDPSHPDYYAAAIETDEGTFHVTWGRLDQPADTVLLGSIGDRPHPAYRGQCRVVVKEYHFGSQSNTVPNTRLLLERVPQPSAGTWPAQQHAQGESIVAGILELMTNPIFGAGIASERFTAAEWEDLSAAVMAGVGRHAPALERAQPLRDVVRDLMLYYDGWCRLEGGTLTPGRFSHDGSLPSGLTEITAHDVVERPAVRAASAARVINEVVVIYRDRNDLLKNAEVSEIASDSVAARLNTHEPRRLEMPAIIDASQAARYAAEAAASGAEGEWAAAGVKIRRARAVWADGSPLQAGDNFQLDLLAAETDQVVRVAKRIDPFRGPVELDLVAERGVFPTPYERPPDTKPLAAIFEPDEIAQKRVFEVPAGLAPSPIGLHAAFLAKRPAAVVAGESIRSTHVVGFYLWHSPTGSSYDWLAGTRGWAVRGVLRGALSSSSADVTALLTMDTDNIDLARFVVQSAADQADDALMLIVGDEVLSVGSISVTGLDWDLGCKRARRASLAAAHSIAAECWLVYRSEMDVFTHLAWVEDTDRYLKLQPYMATGARDLADISALLYHFRDRAPEAPEIVLGSPPGSAVQGQGVQVTATFSDENADLAAFRFWAVRMVSGSAVDEHELAAGAVDPSARSGFISAVNAAFPYVGTWRLRAAAVDAADVSTFVESADFTVAPASIGDPPSEDPPPSPTAATRTASGTYQDSAGTTYAYADYSVPALPGGTAVLQALLKRTDTGNDWELCALLTNDAAAAVVRVEGLIPGRSYYFGTRTFNAYSAASAIVNAASNPFTAPADAGAPSAPTGLAAAVSGRTLSLSWTASTEPDLSEYQVWRNTSNNSGTATKIADVDGTRFVDSGLTIGQPYYYWLKAVDLTENASGFSAVASATPVAVPVGDVDPAAPAAPGAATKTSEGTYLGADGTAWAYLVLSVPILPAGARYQNVYFRKSGSSEWQIAAQVANAGGAVTVRIDDLATQQSYEVALQAFSFAAVPSSITAATGSPFTTVADTTAPAAPASASLTRDGVVPKFIPNTSALLFGTRATWPHVADKDLSHYEVKGTLSNSDGATDYTWLPQNGDTVARVVENTVCLYNETLQAGYVRVRAVDKSGNTSAWVAAGNANGTTTLGTGTISTQSTTDVKISALKLGDTAASSVRQIKARYVTTLVLEPTGGAPTETFSIDISNRGFAGAPQIVHIAVVGGTYLTTTRAAHDYDHASNSASTIYGKLWMRDGSNIPAAPVRLTITAEEHA